MDYARHSAVAGDDPSYVYDPGISFLLLLHFSNCHKKCHRTKNPDLDDVKGLVKFETRAAESIIVDRGATAADHHSDAKQVNSEKVLAVSLVLAHIVVVVGRAAQVHNGTKYLHVKRP